MSLRVRLMLVTLAMVAVALFLAGWATHAALKSFLIDRVDRDLTSQQLPQLARIAGFGEVAPPPPSGGRHEERRGPSSGFRSRTIAQLRDASGVVLGDVSAADDDVDLPARVAPGFSTVDLGEGAGEYRLLSVSAGSREADQVPSSIIPAGGTLIVGVPLSGVNDTLQRLLMIELAVGALTLGALDRLAQPVVQQAAVGQTGEGVVVGLALQMAGSGHALGDVLAGGDEMADFAVEVADRADGLLLEVDLAVAPPVGEHGPEAAAVAEGLPQLAIEAG